MGLLSLGLYKSLSLSLSGSLCLSGSPLSFCLSLSLSLPLPLITTSLEILRTLFLNILEQSRILSDIIVFSRNPFILAKQIQNPKL